MQLYFFAATIRRRDCDLSFLSSSSRKVLQLARLDSVNSLDCARRLFGITFGIGISKPVTAHYGNVVNLINVVAAELNFGVNRVAEFVSSEGLDFVYDYEARVLKICVRYSRVVAQSEVVKATLKLGVLEIAAHRMVEVADNFDMVLPGTFFVRDGSLLEEILVNEHNITVHDSELLQEFRISLNEAAELIEDYFN
jgi:hypothetical protein